MEEKTVKNKLTQKQLMSKAGFYGLLVVFALLRAVGTYVFIVPNAFAPGGIGGLASILYNMVAVSNPSLANSVFNPAVTVFVLNLPLIIAAFFVLNKQFAINTTIVVLFYSGFMALFSVIEFPVFQGQGPQSALTFLAAIVGGVASGVSLGGTLLTNSSSGGTDIIGKITYKHNPDSSVSWLIFMFDSVVVLLSGVIGFITARGQDSTAVFVGVITPILYSFISLFITSEVADVMTTGLQSSVVFNIITDKADELGQAIVNVVHRGATVIDSTGVYTNADHKMLVCVVRKKQSALLKKVIREIDPNVFMYISKAKEVNGFGFRSGN